MTQPPRIAAIGFGAMARSLTETLTALPGAPVVGAALVRPQARTRPPADIAAFETVADLIDWAPDLVVECAGHAGVRDACPALLRAGIPVILVSVGALGDDDLRATLEAAAAEGGAALEVSAGAIGGLDVLRAARLAGLDQVVYRGIKPPAAWRGTKAEQMIDLSALTAPAAFYEGDAAGAARDFPKNANVTAAVALAGPGFARTRVTLIADPTAARNRHELLATGAFGEMTVSLENEPLPANPRTSRLAALSLAQAVLRRFQSARY